MLLRNIVIKKKNQKIKKLYFLHDKNFLFFYTTSSQTTDQVFFKINKYK